MGKTKPADEPIVEETDEAPELSARAAAINAEAAELDAKSDAAIVADRSADASDKAREGEHVKVFVLPPGPKPTEANGFVHEANFAATRQYMMSQGLRPTGDVRHLSTKPHKGDEARGWDITYAVPAVPAERFDFAQVPVITENEDPDADGHVEGTADDGAPAPAESNDDAAEDTKPTA